MATIEYARNPNELLQTTLDQLALDPWNLSLLAFLRKTALERLAAGYGKKRVYGRPGSVMTNLIRTYRKMAWEPANVDHLLEIARRAHELSLVLPPPDCDRANAVACWAVKLIKRAQT